MRKWIYGTTPEWEIVHTSMYRGLYGLGYAAAPLTEEGTCVGEAILEAMDTEKGLKELARINLDLEEAHSVVDLVADQDEKILASMCLKNMS